ncbi:hypothetical protein CLU81_4965 [Flavobacterium sp. 9]|nr:hypothetical protein CLU81_4965 [Flavobacterium sp. 9]
MKTQKMSLSNIQGRLTRSELKTIMAGSGVYDGPKSVKCCNQSTGRCGDCASSTGIPTCSQGYELKDC